MKENSNVVILENTKEIKQEFAKNGYGQDEIILNRDDIEALEKRRYIRILRRRIYTYNKISEVKEE